MSLTNKFSYNYKQLIEGEVIAIGFSIYFYDKAYAVENLPVMQREIDGVLGGITNTNKITVMEIIQNNKAVLENLKSRSVASKTETQMRLDAIQ